MPHPILGPDAVRRDVFVAPSRLARETALVADTFALLAPWLNRLAEDAEEFDAAAEAAVAAVWTIAQGGSADADTAHDRLTSLAQECEDSGDFDDASTARIAWLAAAWLKIKVGRRLRSETAEDDPHWRFGGLVNVLALPRLDRDFRELFDALDRELSARDTTAALDALFPAMDPLLKLVAAEADGPALAASLRHFATGGDIDVAAVHARLESTAPTAEEEVDMASHRLANAAWALAVWLRMRSGDDFGYEADFRDRYPEMSVRALAEQIVWVRAGVPVEDLDTVRWHPEHCDLYAATREIREVYHTVTGTRLHDAHRPEISTAAYEHTIASIVERLSALPGPRRLQLLLDWISPLLDEVAWENRDFMDEPEMTTAEAVERFRRIAAGEDLDADAVHCQLTSFALGESEDQDPDMHVRSQAAFLAADWLCLYTGRILRVDEELLGPYEPQDLAGIVNMLAWTRSRQVILLPEYVDEYPDIGGDVVSPLIELNAMSEDLTPSG